MNIVDRFHIKTKDTKNFSVNHHPDLSIKLYEFSKVAEIITKCKSKKTETCWHINVWN